MNQLRLAPRQQVLFEDCCPIRGAVAQMSEAPADLRGAVYTKPEVVDFILNLAGYTPDRPLHRLSLIEPSFGSGRFLLAAAERLIRSLMSQSIELEQADLKNAIRGVELSKESFRATKVKLIGLLTASGFTSTYAQHLADAWLLCDDFLLTTFDRAFDVVVGNPPYLRQESIPPILLAEYRRCFSSIYDRADLYVPFIERSLQLLKVGGALAFICSDRWTKNRYGRPLRHLISKNFRLKFYVDMNSTPAFTSDVIAYPAITVITREAHGPTRVAFRPDISSPSLLRLSEKLNGPANGLKSNHIQVVEVLPGDDQPWLLSASDQIGLIRRLESSFAKMEEVGCRVGIGVATGADKVFIGPYETLDVEPQRKLKLVMTNDIRDGKVEWGGLGILNPFDSEGRLVALDSYPRFAKFLELHRETILSRHVAKKTPASWYRTIDKINIQLCQVPKLLIPDIKGSASVVFENSGLYPHHNLYYVTSDTWDLRILRLVFLSGIAHLFVSAYSTEMRGGYFRFQAQYLRKIRLPRIADVPKPLMDSLQRVASEGRTAFLPDSLLCQLYGLSDGELDLLKRQRTTSNA